MQNMPDTLQSPAPRGRVDVAAPRRLFILNLHGIGAPNRELPASERAVWIDEPRFEQLLDWVQDRSDIELTFDDSNESDFAIALPALQVRGMKAQFFLVAGRLGQSGYLSPSQAVALQAARMRIGSHGLCHRPWARLNQTDLHEELFEARDRLEQVTGTTIRDASCPYGSYNRRVIRELRAAGYQRVYTSDGGPTRSDAFLLPRNSVSRTFDLAMIKAMISKPVGASLVWRQLKIAVKRWR